VNDLAFVLRAVDLLRTHGLRTWVFGGWGEELRGLAAPWPHADVDLLYPAPGWDRVDALDLEWIRGKRLPWKRAFVLDETMVELLLVELDDGEWVTRLPGRVHRWPPNVFAAGGRLPVASAAALAGYRAAYASRRAA
jgi:hypothetical protein